MNVATVVGNVASEPRINTYEGRMVCSFSLGIRDGTEGTFIDVSCWDKRAEFCSNYIKVGRLIGASGRLKMKKVEDGKGCYVGIVANEIRLYDGKSKSETKEVSLAEVEM